MKAGASVDDMVEAFDDVRKRFEPTNGECLAVFAVLAADVIAEAGPIADRQELARPAIALIEVRANSDNESMERQALAGLFHRCGLALPRRQRPTRDEGSS